MTNMSIQDRGLNFLRTYLASGSIKEIGGVKVSMLNKGFKCDHLLMVHLGADSILKKDLAEIYPPFLQFCNRKSFNGHDMHEHEFALINLLSKKILLFGLGRKCEIFMHDTESGEPLIWGIQNPLSASTVFNSNDVQPQSFDAYFEGDSNQSAKLFVQHVANVGSQIRDREYLPIVPYYIEEISASIGQDREQLLEEQGIDEDEFFEIEKSYAQVEKSIKESLTYINQFFPEIYEETLNSDDF